MILGTRSRRAGRLRITVVAISNGTTGAALVVFLAGRRRRRVLSVLVETQREQVLRGVAPVVYLVHHPGEEIVVVSVGIDTGDDGVAEPASSEAVVAKARK